MDPHRVLESLARDKGVPLSGLGEVGARVSASSKVACCGGIMTRLVTESAADSTVLLRDGSGSCYCAIHGDITSRYPDVLTTGALLLFTDVTVLVLSSKVPPLLIACLQNLSGLLLPDEASAAAVAVMDTGDSLPLPVAAAAATADSPFFHSHSGASESMDDHAFMPRGGRGEREENASHQAPLLGGALRDSRASMAALGGSVRASRASTTHREAECDTPLASKRTRVEDTAGVPAEDSNRAANGGDDDDDAECLELVDDF